MRWEDYAQTEIGEVRISTLHVFATNNQAEHWETMVIGGKYDRRSWRTYNLIEARSQHENAVALVRGDR